MVCPDAVVVVPGIMGSKLETDEGVIWGIDDLRWYAHAWTHPRSALDGLALDEDERRGSYGRVRPTGLLQVAAWAPFLQGLEPYHALVAGIRDVVVDRAAVLEFSYDWRLPAAYNAGLLCHAAEAHLAAWRAHPEYHRFRRDQPDARPAQLVFIAHSMGGLVVRALPRALDVRATVTLATPFHGAAKAATILHTGRGTPIPLPRKRLRTVAKTMPGLHDLLPSYRCLEVPDPRLDPIRLTPQHVAALGGDAALAAAAFAARELVADRPIPGQHQALIGIEQPTGSSLTLTGDELVDHPYTFEPLPDGSLARDGNGLLVRHLRHGDGTVPYNSALIPGIQPVPLAQQHGPIAKSEEAIKMVQTVLLANDPHATPLGEGGLSLQLPDLIPLGRPTAVPIGGVDGPADATVTVCDEDGRIVDALAIGFADGRFQVVVELDEVGIYQVEVSGGGTSAVSQRCLVTDS